MSASSAAPPTEDAVVLQLPADLGIESVAALKQTLAAQLDAASLTIDATAASRLHAAALQLLAAFCRSRKDAGHATRWSAASASFTDAVRALGLTPMLGFEGVKA
ncbi:STAS domain-containing protein [Solimonas marina]|uniref:STAS domain-containing protein n=1 Tax=Solimonas marina TaxID=2714601 RepID=A0A969W8Y3_9GAMM|nr:STAS domain-containing protein [Solimonas marina]NKF21715.1 STAS domain-containing protein [Solimonas marina]